MYHVSSVLSNKLSKKSIEYMIPKPIGIKKHVATKQQYKNSGGIIIIFLSHDNLKGWVDNQLL